MSGETNNVTLELSTGRFVHVMHDATSLEFRIGELDEKKMDGMMRLLRMDGKTVLVRASQIVAIYPLDSRSEPPDFAEIAVNVPRPGEVATTVAKVLRRYGFGGPS